MKEITSDEVKSTKLVEELILTKLVTNSKGIDFIYMLYRPQI